MGIILTGTPGSGKSALGKILAKKLGYGLIRINALVDKDKLVKGVENGVRVVDLKKLRSLLLKEIRRTNNVVIEGHLACEFKLPGCLVIVTRTNPEILKKRLVARGYDKAKLEKNVLCELLDYCSILSLKNYSRVYEIDTSKDTDFAIKQVDRILSKKDKKLKAGWIDWSNYLYEELR